MKKEQRPGAIKFLEELLQAGGIFILVISAVIIGIALFDTNSKGEAPIGSFESEEFNSGWRIIEEDGENPITLPMWFDKDSRDVATIVNTLPSDLADGTSLMIRASMQDVHIFVGDQERVSYSSAGIDGMGYYIPSAYIVVQLNAADAGQEIRIMIRFKAIWVINGVTISHGNNVWFPVLKSNLFVNIIAAVVLGMGLILIIAVMILGGSFRVGAARQLSLLMIDASLWVFSESALRQFFFRRPSMNQYFAYFLVEMIGLFACMYFDEVQHKYYHRRYLLCETVALFIVMANIILHATGVIPLYRTIVYAHIWTGVCALVSIISIVTDIIRKRARSYRFIMIGMVLFIAFSLIELAGFYVSRLHVFGFWICWGLLVLMAATIIQTIYDEVTAYSKREKNRTAMTINTIETIASAIDARDEYTGGHSERVGLYASRLAREMAADYNLSEEDILRVHYIGLVHDIGKIGVADSVLNKTGHLTEEEFNLMKKHTEIGYEIMGAMGDNIEGLLDGIRHHHERFDGKGYPDGLSDTDIPLIARILTIADSYDAMTSNRVYRKRLTDEQVKAEFRRCSGTQFDPALTEIFLRLLDEGELSALTVDGSAADETGRLRASSVLEGKLCRDILSGITVDSASHVRMLCYLMKLMEKKGRDYRVFFVTLRGIWADPPAVWETGASLETDHVRRDTQSVLTSLLKNSLSQHDINIHYTGTQNIIALYDRNDEETEAFLQTLSQVCPRASVEALEDLEVR